MVSCYGSELIRGHNVPLAIIDTTSEAVPLISINQPRRGLPPLGQIERFYARNLPLSKEMAINLQSFGSE
jgi:hypothetical protein